MAKWIQKAVRKMTRKGTKGSLTRAAKRAGFKSALSYARHIKNNPSKYSASMRRKANFAINASKSKR